MKVELSELTWKDRTSFYKWINNKEVIKYSLSLFQKISTEDEIDKWFRSVLDDKSSVSKGIFYEDCLIGYAGIASISSTNNSGEYFIFIGDKDVWGRGIGTEVTKQVIRLALEELSLNRLSLTVSDINEYGVRAYQSAGFTIEGKMRQAAFRDGKYHDKILMSVIKEDQFNLS